MGMTAGEHKQRLGNTNEGRGTMNMTSKELDGLDWHKKHKQWSGSLESREGANTR
jgi:hypothetical protein